MTAPEVSIIIPAYNEERSLPALLDRLVPVLEQAADGHEIIVVDDGSTDATAETVRRRSAEDRGVRLVRLSRNFGHQPALLAGLARARGQAIGMMDADLQHPPELLPEMLALWRDGHDVVHTVREDTRASAGPLKRLTSRWFYLLLGAGGDKLLEPGMADFRVASRQVVEEVVRSSRSRPFLRGAFSWVGFRQTTVPYRAGERAAGETTYTLGRMVRFAIDGLLAFGNPPLHWPVLAGVMTSLLAFGYGVYAVAVALTTDRAVPGWASLAVLTSVLFGLLFLVLGVLGTYLVAIYRDTRGMPSYVVAEDTEDAEPRDGRGQTPGSTRRD